MAVVWGSDSWGSLDSRVGLRCHCPLAITFLCPEAVVGMTVRPPGVSVLTAIDLGSCLYGESQPQQLRSVLTSLMLPGCNGHADLPEGCDEPQLLARASQRASAKSPESWVRALGCHCRASKRTLFWDESEVRALLNYGFQLPANL